MRRRIQYRESLLPPVRTSKILGIMEVSFFRKTYPIVFAIRDEGVYCIDILMDSSEETVLTFLRTLDANQVDTVYLDPVDSIRSAAGIAFPGANLVVSVECILRYARDAMLNIIQKEGKRFPIRFKEDVLTIPCKHLQNDYQRRKIKQGMESRPRLKAAYEQHQSLMEMLSGEWTYEALSTWAHSLPDDLLEFDPLVDVIDLWEREINCFIAVEKKPPDYFPTALQAVCEAFVEMPNCIFDVLRARCFLTVSHDTIDEAGTKYRIGISTARLIQNMNEITTNIKEAKEYGLK